MSEKRKTTTNTEGIHLWLILLRASRAVENRARKSVDNLGIGLSDFAVLEALLHKGPLPVNTLGRKVLLTSGSMTAAVDRLERNGLVERADDPEDRRSRIVHLTSEGRALIRTAFAQHKRDMESVFSCLDDNEKSGLANLLRKLGLSAAASE